MLKNKVILRIVKLLDVILLIIPLLAIWDFYYANMIPILHRDLNVILITLIFVLVYMLYGRIYDGFLVSTVRISEMIYSQCLALFVADIVEYMIFCLILQSIPNVLPVFLMFLIQMVMIIIWAYGTHIWYFKFYPPKQTAVIYDSNQDISKLIYAYGLTKKFTVSISENINDCIKNNFGSLNSVEVVFLCGIHSHERNILLKYCIKKNIRCYIMPSIGDVIMSGAKKMHLFHLPMLRVGRYEPSPEYLFCKRLFDIVVSSMLLVVFMPIMVITSIAIKLEDGGKVFYRQKRLTQNGKIFEIIKYRSMQEDAEKDGIARLSTGKSDMRITRVGKVIRELRIDELPQLFNILSGNMSIVGPRPERPEIAKIYEQKLPEFALRLQAKAGLTGYAQVYGKYNTTPYNKLQLDLMYIAHPSIWEDLKIIFVTVKILFMKESTEGLAEGQTTANDIKTI